MDSLHPDAAMSARLTNVTLPVMSMLYMLYPMCMTKGYCKIVLDADPPTSLLTSILFDDDMLCLGEGEEGEVKCDTCFGFLLSVF